MPPESNADAVKTPLFERIGGTPVLRAMVEELYHRVLSDSELAPFFEHIDFAKLKGRTVMFLSQELGGLTHYKCQDMKTAHAHLPVTDENFTRMIDHMQAALRAVDVPESLAADVAAVLTRLRSEIVNTPSIPDSVRIRYCSERRLGIDRRASKERRRSSS